MQERFEAKINELIEKCDEIKKEYKMKLQDLYIKQIALGYTNSKIEFNKETFDEIFEYIKTNVSKFSELRSTKGYLLAQRLITDFSNSKEAFNTYLKCIDKMTDSGFKKSSFLNEAAFTMVSTTIKENIDEVIYKAYELYNMIKMEHKFLTSPDDYKNIVLLAQMEADVQDINREVEETYECLVREKFGKNNYTQELSHILTMIKCNDEESIRKFIEIKGKFKKEKIRLSANAYGLISFLLLLKDEDEALTDINNIIQLLSKSKTFKYNSKEINTMFAISIYLNDCIENDNIKINSLVKTQINLIIANQINLYMTMVMVSVVT